MTYLKVRVAVPVSGIFISIPRIRTPIPSIQTPATIVGTAITPATTTPTASSTPHFDQISLGGLLTIAEGDCQESYIGHKIWC